MAGEGEWDAQTQGSNQLETFVEGNETLDGKDGTAPKELGQMSAVHMSPKAKVCQHGAIERRVRKQLLEVFSVKLPEWKKHNTWEQMYGCILILSDLSYVVLDRVKRGTPLNIDAEGFLRLRGPNRVIDASDFVSFTARLFKHHAGADQFIRDKEREDLMLWNAYTRIDYNKHLTGSVKSQFGPIVVKYAVYKDAAEAWVNVRIVACQFPTRAVYGTVTAHNSCLHEEGTSVLFNRNREEGIYLDVISDSDKGKYAHLPLSRSKTAHPLGSHVTIHLDIKQRGNAEEHDQPIVSAAELCFETCLSGQKMLCAADGAWLVEVVVTWHEEDDLISKGPPVV